MTSGELQEIPEELQIIRECVDKVIHLFYENDDYFGPVLIEEHLNVAQRLLTELQLKVFKHQYCAIPPKAGVVKRRPINLTRIARWEECHGT